MRRGVLLGRRPAREPIHRVGGNCAFFRTGEGVQAGAAVAAELEARGILSPALRTRRSAQPGAAHATELHPWRALEIAVRTLHRRPRNFFTSLSRDRRTSTPEFYPAWLFSRNGSSRRGDGERRGKNKGEPASRLACWSSR